ncbi:unnamed protein product [Pieris macdunnoughi]|uniref:Uncharacterized protein n=1 Tax=Pieris macdunnoughi TaxID=345717 RepID=A0A821NYE8_9NEOP|nr:unnamed protein product [Pieris macdunnoughi]
MNKTKRYELVAPDGGYGFVILIAVTINMAILGTHLNSYGIIYNNYFIELGMKSTYITFLCGISAMFAALSGFLTAPLLRVLSMRQTVLLGALFYNCGVFCTIFAEHKIIFLIFQGVFQNIGYGLIFNISNTITTNEYFVKKRILAISVTQTIVAFVAFIEPHIFKLTTEWYGHRGTLIIVCAISVHSFFAGVLMQPVAWHMKIEEIPYETEMKLLLKEHTEMSQKTPADINAGRNLEIKDKESFIHRVRRILDMELIKSYSLSVECVGPGICLIIDLTYMYMIPSAFNSFGWSEGDVAWAFTLVALGDVLTKIFLIVISKWFNKYGSNRVYIFGIILTLAARLGITSFDNMTAALTLFTILGVSRCILFIFFCVGDS